MTKGYALTIGLNLVDPNHYVDGNGDPWNGQLFGCEFDANDMAKIANINNFKVITLLTKEATRNNVLENIGKIASSLDDGDIFLLSYSGHGGNITDYNRDEEEIDKTDFKDETWCLYDGELIDDEIFSALSNFKKGVRTLVFSDSCHSGTVVRAIARGSSSPKINKNDIGLSKYNNINPIKSNVDTETKKRYRYAPADVLSNTYRKNIDFYQSILKNTKNSESTQNAIQSSVILFSGCQDNQLSRDGDSNGLFTSRLLQVWNNGSFEGSYVKFYNDVINLMPTDIQKPNYFKIGLPNIEFESQKPFKI
jgi:hypothetical protein